jgi:hypothetical protein
VKPSAARCSSFAQIDADNVDTKEGLKKFILSLTLKNETNITIM